MAAKPAREMSAAVGQLPPSTKAMSHRTGTGRGCGARHTTGCARCRRPGADLGLSQDFVAYPDGRAVLRGDKEAGVPAELSGRAAASGGSRGAAAGRGATPRLGRLRQRVCRQLGGHLPDAGDCRRWPWTVFTDVDLSEPPTIRPSLAFWPWSTMSIAVSKCWPPILASILATSRSWASPAAAPRCSREHEAISGLTTGEHADCGLPPVLSGVQLSLVDDLDMGDAPIRLFQGTDDDSDLAGPCPNYANRLRRQVATSR